jgi:hypothetical protein
MKKTYFIFAVLAFGILTQAMKCVDEDYPDQEFVMSEEKVPQDPYFTTISAAYFYENITGHGWKWNRSLRIDGNGNGSLYYITSWSDMIPNDLYFGVDSLTLFMYKQDSNLQRTDSYTYDATNNRIKSNAITYMQLIYADTTNIFFIERLGDHYYKNYYERMLPYELNARRNGSKPEKQ